MRRVITIQSGNTKYLGLSVPEWCVALIPAGGYLILLEGKVIFLAAVLHQLLIVVYTTALNKLEENILPIIVSNNKIPSVVQGYFVNPSPKSSYGSRITNHESVTSDDE